MSMTIVDVREIRPIDRGEAMELATIGYERLLSLVDDLEADDWERSTDCEAWTIKDIVSHLLGEAEAFASMREFVHQFRISSREARASAIQPADAMNALQVQERSHLSPDELAFESKSPFPWCWASECREGCINLGSSSCGLVVILMNQTAEAVAAPNGRSRGVSSGSDERVLTRRLKPERAVRPVVIVVIDEGLEHEPRDGALT